MKAKYFLHTSVILGLLTGMVLGSIVATGWDVRDAL